MKRSIKHFRKNTREELEFLLHMIKKQISRCHMVILYGSYARGDYVLWDERVEFGIHTSYQSDYDILIVVSDLNIRITENNLRHKVLPVYNKVFAGRRHAIPRFIVENINVLNENLEHRHYFFTDLVKDGIMLYNDKVFKLAKPCSLNYKEIKDIAEREFNIYYPSAVSMLKGVKSFFLKDKDYMNAAFLLHQVAEKFYYAILLVCMNYRPKNHKLAELQAMVKSLSRDLSFVFPMDTQQAQISYELLCRAYIEARYNMNYQVSREQIQYLITRLDFLREVTHRLCQEKLSFYESQIENKGNGLGPDMDESGPMAAEN